MSLPRGLNPIDVAVPEARESARITALEQRIRNLEQRITTDRIVGWDLLGGMSQQTRPAGGVWENITGIGGYRAYRIVWMANYGHVDPYVGISLRINGDEGQNYTSTNFVLDTNGTTSLAQFGNAHAAAGRCGVAVGNNRTNNACIAHGWVEINNGASGYHKGWTFQSSASNNGTSVRADVGGGQYKGSSVDITQLSVLEENNAGGVFGAIFTCYGLRA